MLKYIQKNHYYLLLHFTVFLWGFTGILGKVIKTDSTTIVILRTLIAFIVILIYLALKGKLKKIQRRNLISYLGIGGIIAVHWVTFFESIKVSNVSVALICLASASFFVAILEPIIYGKKLKTYELILGLTVISGLSMIFNFESEYSLGIILSLCSAFFAALFTVLNARFVKEDNAAHITLYEMLGAFIFTSIYYSLQDQSMMGIFSMDGLDWLYIIILGTICTAFAFLTGVYVMRELSPYTISISVNMEPIYSILLALLFFQEDEKMSFGFYLGGLVILLTIFMNAYLKSKERKRKLMVITANENDL